MWTVRDLSDNQVCVGLQVTSGFRDGIVTYLTHSGTDTFAHVYWAGDVAPTTVVKNGESDLQVVGWMR